MLHCIGTDYGRRAWVNPHTDGQVVVTMSSWGFRDKPGAPYCGPHVFVGNDIIGICRTQNTPNSWISVDLGAKRTVVPTHYCLRHSGGYGGGSWPVLRNWTLEGKATDEGDWHEIRRHDNDETMPVLTYANGAWPIDVGGRAFRHLRIRTHGETANFEPGYNGMLICCGFEVYGRLLDAGA
eukprot:COSAG02_NODE_8671_length_2485_cov_3.643963_3_plen_181_part_00